MKKLTIILAAILLLGTTNQGLQRGFNNPWFFGKFQGFYPPDSVIGKIRALDRDYLRFPGGTIANGYRLDLPGYGYPGERGDNYIYAQVKLAQATGTATIYVANLYQPLVQPDSEQMYIGQIVEAARILNPPVIELGNELPIYSTITGVTSGDPRFLESKTKFAATVKAGAQRYTQLCEKVMAAVRAAGLNPVFAVTMDQPLHLRGKTWNSHVRAWGKYQGEIFHYYSTRRDVPGISADFNKIFAGAIRPIFITEYGWDHGFTSEKNLADIGKPYWLAFDQNFQAAALKDPRIRIIIRHQLYGDNPYSVIKQ